MQQRETRRVSREDGPAAAAAGADKVVVVVGGTAAAFEMMRPDAASYLRHPCHCFSR